MTPSDSAPRASVTSRLIAAPIERVFGAFADPALLARWWGPKDFTGTIQQFEFHAGGDWRMILHGPDGTDYPNHSRFVEIEAARRVVFEHLGSHHFFMTLTLEPEAGGTRVHWHQEFDDAEHYRRIAGLVDPANEQNLDRWTAVVTTGG